MTDRQKMLLRMWEQEAELVRAAQEREKRLRKELAREFFDGASEGTHRADLGDGYALKASIPINRSVDRDALIAFSLDPKRPEWFDGISRELFPFKPTIAVGAWKKLAPEQRAVLAPIVTEKEGMPSLELVEPS